ncbi:NADH dehydrogenase [ubiquinone] 1 alpha subcomplex subunit 11 [Anolis sagrei]|uniref:NADH dehydrogenase [ubiquinone] 1 alpha subcomplex subunit 11 n=1 Tax=Anolis sagrei TaxID=38937 RepID=UPI0035210B20
MSGYWDIPEGTECAKKTWLTGRLGAAVGLVGSIYHIILFPSETALHAIQRATSATVTMATLGAVFGVTTCLSAEIRDTPEDPWNYFAGGCASGALLGARARNFGVGTASCLGLGTLAAFVKIGKKEGWRLVGPPIN